MSGLEIESTGSLITSYNGDTIDNTVWDANYNGELMDIETIHNNDYTHIQMDNNDISRLFNNIGSMNNCSIENRLQNDYGAAKRVANKKSVSHKKSSKRSPKKSMSHKKSSKKSHKKSMSPKKSMSHKKSVSHKKSSKRSHKKSISKKSISKNKLHSSDLLDTIY